MTIKDNITEYFTKGEINEKIIREEIITNDVVTLNDAIKIVLELRADDTVSKKDALRFLVLLMSKMTADEFWLKAITAKAISELGTYKSISALTEFIIEPNPGKDDTNEKVVAYYKSKHEVLDKIVEMAKRKSKALKGLFRVTELGDEEFKQKAIEQLKAIYLEKPKVELYEYLGEEVQRQGETSTLAEMYNGLPEPTGTYGD